MEPLMRAWLCAAAVALAGCGNAVLGVQLHLVTAACSQADSSRNPVAGVTQLRIKVTGDNLTPVTVTAPFAQGNASVPNVPVGTNRRVSVEALAGANVRARGDSGPFDATGSSDLALTIALRVVDAFTPTADLTGTACSSMASPRAGHAMALLPDGRVLITGGFSFGASGSIIPHSDAELYDPATGKFSAVSSSRFQRWGHAALPIQIGTAGAGVLLLGGEGPDASGAGGPVKPLELFDSGAFSTIQPANSSPAREHQAAALDVRTGFALMAGGQSGPDFSSTPTVLASAAYYDPQTGAVRDSATVLPKPLTDAVAVPRVNKTSAGAPRGGVVLIGGRDQGLKPTAQVSGLIWLDTANDFANDPAFTQASLAQLPTPRYRHSAVALADDTVLVMGGLVAATDSNDYSSPTGAVSVVDPTGAQIYDTTALLNQPRAEGCAVALEDGQQVLFAGGAYKDSNGLHSGRDADIVTGSGRSTSVRSLQGPTTGDWALIGGRHRAACIRLRDGSVLVTGGLQANATGAPTVLQSAEIYTPVGK
jgi:hypothetical protein